MPTIAILIPAHNSYSRAVMRGIAQYARQRPSWTLKLCMWMLERPVDGDWPQQLKAMKVDGLLVQSFNPRRLRRLLDLGLPVVNVTPCREPVMPAVVADDWQVGRMAAEHFLDRQLKSFLYLELRGFEFARRRWEGFRRRLRTAGFSSHFGTYNQAATDVRSYQAGNDRTLGVFGCYDLPARAVVSACIHQGLAVPEQVAVLGVDNDEVLCDLLEVPLSSIDLGADRIGFQAAQLLAELMSGRRPPRRPILVPPRQVVVRQSSDILAVEDAALRAALAYIKENAHRPIQVSHVVEEVLVARRSLERAFREVLGRSISQEIYRVRIDRAKDLLASSDLSIADIAHQCGFRWLEHFSQRFHRATGQPPSHYARRFRNK